MLKNVLNLYRYVFWSPEKYVKYIGVKVGEGCRIRSRHFGSEPFLIEIGNQVQVTDGVRFSTHGGGWTLRKKFPNFDCFGKIKVGNNVYIGNCALIMPGVTIGNNVIIGAGSVVTKSVLDGSIIGGNPGRVIGNVTDFEERMLPYNLNIKNLSYQEKKAYLLSLPAEKFISK